MKISRFVSVLLCAALMLTLIPVTALAAEETVGDFVVSTENAAGYTYDPSSGNLQFTQPGDYTVSMKAGVTISNGKIQVTAGATGAVNITLSGVSIQNGYCAFDVKSSSSANLTLAAGTTNTLTSGGNYPGIRCLPGATISIGGTGTLNLQGGMNCPGIGGDAVSNLDSGNIIITGGTILATGGDFGAGIGGAAGGAGNVTISGGMVTAIGRSMGAGIGGGAGGNGGTVTITGGTVTATGASNGDGGAGIGGGAYNGVNYGNGGTVYISGGSVLATGGPSADNIGHGMGGSNSGILMNQPAASGGNNVYLTTVTLEGLTGVTAVTSLTASLSGASYSYNTTDMATDSQGKLYLYLPENSSVTAAQIPGATPPDVITYSGAITTKNDHTAAGTLNVSLPQLQTPTGLAWDSTTPGRAKWSAVANAAGYSVQLFKNGGAHGSPANVASGTECDFTAAIAAAGSGNYTFKVTAVGDGTSYLDSAQSNASAAYSYPTSPSAPRSFSAAPGNGQVVLSWSAPASNGGSAITKYEVSKDNGTNWTDATSATGHTFTGLTNGQSYTFKVRAVNSVGTGADAIVTATPQTPAPPPVPTVSATVSPAAAAFDKNPAKQADVSTTITWGDASSVSYVKAGGASVGSDNYSVSGNTLTIKKEYLATQAVGSLVLTIGFNMGGPAALTIAVSDTTPSAYKVTFDPQGGTVSPASKTVRNGETYGALPTPARMGHTFGGWYTQANGGGIRVTESATVSITVDQTLIAKWTPQTPSAALTGIKLSAGSLSPGFSPAKTKYTVNLTETVSGVTVTPVKAYDGATMTIDGKQVSSKTIALANGMSATMTIRVICGRTSRTYTLTIKRPKSTNCSLAALSASGGTFDRPFNPNVTAYTLTLAEDTKSVRITDTVASKYARASFTRKTFALRSGEWETARITVTAQSGARKVYTVRIHRLPSNDATLRTLTTNSGRFKLTPGFAPSIASYSVTLPASSGSVTLYFKANGYHAAVTVNGATRSSYTVRLGHGGSAKVRIRVISQAGRWQEYVVTVTRP